jgi:hypothetical protein
MFWVDRKTLHNLPAEQTASAKRQKDYRHEVLSEVPQIILFQF